jgi:hypothetical protein
MKFKLKPLHIGIILILLYLGSMIPMIGLREKTVTLPKENVINYRLTQEQEDYAVKLGKTVINFEYDANCEVCLEQKELLEKIATENKDQIILQEVSMGLGNFTKLRFISYYGEKILRNASENEIWDALCILMINPPTYCALRGI